MIVNNISQKASELSQRLAELKAKCVSNPANAAEFLSDALDGLRFSIEELSAADEELMQQNEELRATIEEFQIEAKNRKQAEGVRLLSEEQFRRAVEDAPIPMIMHSEDGQILQISHTWTELTGYTSADMSTFDAWLNRAYGEGADSVRDYMQKLFQGNQRMINIEFPIHTSDGQIRYWSFSASSPGRLLDGRRFIMGMAVDITDRKRAEEALHKGERRFKDAIDNFPNVLVIYDSERRIRYINSKGLQIIGLSEQEVIGRRDEELFPPEMINSYLPALKHAIETKMPQTLERTRHASMGGAR